MKNIYQFILVGIIMLGLMILGADHEDGLTMKVFLIKVATLVVMFLAGLGLRRILKDEEEENENLL